MENNNEKILIKALELLEQGRSKEEILNLFPKNRKEVEEVLATAHALTLIRSAVVPPKKLLADMLDKMEAVPVRPRVTSAPKFRLARWLVLVPVGGLALLLVLSLAATKNGPTIQTLETASPSADTETLGVSAGDIFDLSAIEQEASAVGFDADLYEFLDQEAGLEEVDAILTNL